MERAETIEACMRPLVRVGDVFRGPRGGRREVVAWHDATDSGLGAFLLIATRGGRRHWTGYAYLVGLARVVDGKGETFTEFLARERKGASDG